MLIYETLVSVNFLIVTPKKVYHSHCVQLSLHACRHTSPLLTILCEISSKKSKFRVRKASFELKKCVSSKKSEFRVRKASFELKK